MPAAGDRLEPENVVTNGIIQATISRYAAAHIEIDSIRSRARAQGIDESIEISDTRDGCRVTCRMGIAQLLIGELSAAADTAPTEVLRKACAISANIVRDAIERPYVPLQSSRDIHS